MRPLERLQRRVMHESRTRKLEHFYALARAGQRILDVGVSAESGRGRPQRNLFLKNYRFDPGTYTGLGVQDLSGMPDRYPGKTFVTYDGGTFPFADRRFDWAFSNAVIEHVGDEARQVNFLNEMLRVAHNVFFTTPNKYFPVESHTQVLFLHWWDAAFFAWADRRDLRFNRDNLFLLSRRGLLRVVERSAASHFDVRVNRLFGWPMTFSVVCRTEAHTT